MSWHKSRVRAEHPSKLYRTWKVEGEPQTEVLEDGIPEDQLSAREAHWTRYLNPSLTGTTGGRGGPSKLTPERRAQISDQLRGRPPQSEETRKQRRIALTGRTLPDSTKARMREAALKREARKRGDLNG